MIARKGKGVAKKKARSGRRLVFTPEVIAAIPKWVADGVSRADIARALGITPGSLRVGCSLHGISLTTGGTMAIVIRRLGITRWAEIQRQAQRRETMPLQLVTRILIAAVDGNLIDAILDDAEEGVRE